MDLIGLFRLAGRRWYVFGSVLLVALIAGGLAALTISPSYEVDGAFRTNFPYAADTQDSLRVQSNPYSDVAATAIVMTSLAQSPDVLDAVTAKGGTARYTVNDPGNAVMTVSVADPNEQNVLRTYRILHTELQQRLGDLQKAKNIPQAYWVTVDDMTAPTIATKSLGGRDKVAIAAAVLGVILAFAATVIADNVLRRRAARATSAPALDPAPEPVDDTPQLVAATPGSTASNGSNGSNGANGGNGSGSNGSAERTARLNPVPAPDRLGQTTLLPITGPVPGATTAGSGGPSPAAERPARLVGRKSGRKAAAKQPAGPEDGDDWPSHDGTVEDDAGQPTVRDRRPVTSDGGPSDLFARVTRLLDGPRR